MHKRIVFRGMDKTQPMEDYCNQQLAKIEEFLLNEPTPIYMDLALQPSKTREHHSIELRIKTPHYDKVSNYEGPKFYDVVDRVIDIMYRNLCEEKKKINDRRKETGRHDEVKKQK